jgi:TetR/AcrR family transcriptional regulator
MDGPLVHLSLTGYGTLPYTETMNPAHERKVSERLARRRRIQNVARDVFAQHGFASSIEQIARAAQLSVGSIYLHFRSKDDLCVSLIEDALTRFDIEMSSLRECFPVQDRLAGAWRLLIDWAHHADYARVLRLLAEPGIRAQLSDEVLAAVAGGTSRIKDHLGACIADGITAGLYRPVAAREVAELLWSMLLGCLDACGIQASFGGDELPLAVRACRGFELIEHSLLVSAARAAA